MESSKAVQKPGFGIALASGAVAGLVVDLSLYPLDTIKTRLQSSQGFWKSGGLSRIYAGIGSIAIGSSPGSAVFFCTYEAFKTIGQKKISYNFHFVVHSFAAMYGEVMACLIRVPTDVIKQRAQANPKLSTWSVLQATLKSEGYLGLYRGYTSTLLREIPFSFIQFPIWEYLKITWSMQQGYKVKPWQSSLCGAVAGGIAAGLTTPLDVAKTRIMLAKKGTLAAEGKILPVLQEIYLTTGIQGLFAGVSPRVLWISVGGAIFFGAYEKTKDALFSYQLSL
ncbi:hypothetical protein JTE90_022723 [Oedothorax gibbosus]|uniref:S-adenosylmethionine mitochondrial carrier protein n=1 Tax=Oedothorax gibbosus TaxID=931172 RepID=A0AAV6UNW0_9ARAC|nr:hypothetical protein JTE90_022723 [Oedothorax gibbosus]